MLNEPWNAESFRQYAEKQKEEENRKLKHLNELNKQTSTLVDIKALTKINIECVKDIIILASENTMLVNQIAKMTEENQKSSKRQFMASIIVATSSLVVAILTLIFS